MIYHDVIQGSDDWFDLRRGKPTASNLHRILTPGGKLSKAADKYAAELLAERICTTLPERVESYVTRAMEYGNTTEEEARRYYTVREMTAVQNGGFCEADDRLTGASPDGLVGEDGCLEIKCLSPAVHIQHMIEDDAPSEFLVQCHGHLLVTGRKWCDLLLYCIDLRPIKYRVVPNEFTELLREAVGQFHSRVDFMLAKVNGIGILAETTKSLRAELGDSR